MEQQARKARLPRWGSRVLACHLPAERRCRLHIDLDVPTPHVDHDPVVAAGGLYRDVSRCNIPQDLVGRPLKRVAEAADQSRTRNRPSSLRPKLSIE